MVRLRTRSPVASNSRRARSRERLHADRHEQIVGCAKLFACLDTPILPAQPLAVEEVRACEIGPESRAAEAVDGFAVEALGGLTLAQERA